MARPLNCRCVGCLPAADYFKPRGLPLWAIEEVVLTVDECEALRLADLEGLYQEQAAERMNVSRQTFGRIIESAHRKVAGALVEGKALRIVGGEYQMNAPRTFVCSHCHHTWQCPYGTGRPAECPACRQQDFHRTAAERGRGRGLTTAGMASPADGVGNCGKAPARKALAPPPLRPAMPSANRNRRPVGISLRPIGVIRTPFKDPRGTPIQPRMARGAQGTVEVCEQFKDALKDLEGFERVWLLYWFHRISETRLRVVPYLDEVERGLFATRAPCRPNPIGMSAVRLLRVEGNMLRVADVDILDGTPLLDIKPYARQFDCFRVSRCGWLDKVATRRRVADDRFHQSGAPKPK